MGADENEFGGGAGRIWPIVVSDGEMGADFLEEELLFVTFESEVDGTFGAIDSGREGFCERIKTVGTERLFGAEGEGGVVVVEVRRAVWTSEGKLFGFGRIEVEEKAGVYLGIVSSKDGSLCELLELEEGFLLFI